MLTIIPHQLITKEFTDKFILRIEKKLDIFDYQLKDVYAAKIMDGTYLTWVDDNIVVIGRTVVHETGIMVLYLDTATIDDEEFKGDFVKGLKEIEDGARNSGYNKVVIVGRPGWKRKFKDYSFHSATISKEL